MAGNVYKVERAVTAIQLESMKSGRASPFPSQCPTNEKEQTGVIEKYDARNRQCWDKTKYAELGISDHYTNVAALIIHWARDLDKDLKCTEEAEELHALFRDRLHFNSKIITLDIKSKKRPQLQFEQEVMNFKCENDGPARKNLLILFYTGHGVAQTEKPNDLIISGTRDGESAEDEDVYKPQADWSYVEHTLGGAWADTLEVLDCCFAGNVMKGFTEQTRVWELMTATGKDMLAPSGARSYGKAFIKAMELLLSREQPFTTYDLNQEIHRGRQWDSVSQLYQKLPSVRTRHIVLAPPIHATATQPNRPENIAGYLDVRIAFQDISMLKPDHIQKLCSELCKLPKATDLNVCDLQYLGFTPCVDSPQYKELVRLFKASYVLAHGMARWKEKQKMRLMQKRRSVFDHASDRVREAKRRRTDPYNPTSPVDQVMKLLKADSPLTPESREVTPSS